MRRSLFGKKLSIGFQEIHYSCTVKFLDDREPQTITFQKETLGQQLIDQICSSLDLAEKDFFGLRYVDRENQRHWLDNKKPAYRQLKNSDPMILCFRVKYYPSDPFKLKEEITRYFLFLQLERDLQHGRLLCSPEEIVQITACLLQAKLGDCDEGSVTVQHLSQSNLIPKNAKIHLENILLHYVKLKHQLIDEAEENFMRIASKLDTYGVDPHPVKDIQGNSVYVGISHTGIMVFQGNKKTHWFPWGDISRLDFEGKNFLIHYVTLEAQENHGNKKKKQLQTFKCPNTSACKHLWKCAVEQQCFFTLDSGKHAHKVKANKRLFRRSSTFKFSGLSESEVWLSTSSITREGPPVQRSVSNPQFFRNCRGSETLPASFKPASFNLSSFGESPDSSTSSIAAIDKSSVSERVFYGEEFLRLNADLSGKNVLSGINAGLEDNKVHMSSLEQVVEDEACENAEDGRYIEDSLQVFETISLQHQNVVERKEHFQDIMNSISELEFPRVDVPSTLLGDNSSNPEFFDLFDKNHKEVSNIVQSKAPARSSYTKFGLIIIILLFIALAFSYFIDFDVSLFFRSALYQFYHYFYKPIMNFGYNIAFWL